jgi:hypothetical protein
VADVTAGGVLSTLTVAVLPANMPPHETVQVRLAPGEGVSLVKVVVPQPSVLVSPEGVQLQRSVTSAACHARQSTGVRFASVHEADTLLACTLPVPRNANATRAVRTIPVLRTLTSSSAVCSCGR